MPWMLPALALALVSSCVVDWDVFRGDAPSDGGASATGGNGGNGGNGGMLPASCTNMQLDADESDVDCGGNCTPCANGLSCDGATDCQSGFCDAGSCAACGDSGDCAQLQDSWCDPAENGGSCVPQSMQGQACTVAEACVTGSCADGLCCDSACASGCMACIQTLTGLADGSCGNVLGGFTHGSDCTMTQACDGQGNCATFCGLEPSPPGGACPSECTGGCNAGTCTIDCNASSQCANAMINCPPGFACLVQCGGTNSCNNATISCPDHYACDVSCTGNSGCQDALINCSQVGACDITCGSTSNSCRMTSMLCGTNACSASCNGSNFDPTLTCGSSCGCTPC